MMQKSVEAQKIWATSSMSDRIAVCQQFMDSFESHRFFEFHFCARVLLC